MSTNIKEETEKKLEILKSIIEERPFGFTIMELYNDHKDRHEIGSRNTLKKYLGFLMERGEIRKTIIGNYKVFRSAKYEEERFEGSRPQMFMLKLFSAISTVFKDEVKSKGKLVGKELAKSGQDFFRIITRRMKSKPLETILQRMGKGMGMMFRQNLEIKKENEDNYTMVFRDSEILQEGAWLHYYVFSGMLESQLLNMFNQDFLVDVDSINEKECIIKLKRK